MIKLLELHDCFGQSPWLDTQGAGLAETGLAGWLGNGVLGLTSNASNWLDTVADLRIGQDPLGSTTDSARTIESIDEPPPVELLAGLTLLLRPAYVDSAGSDGLVSVGVSPRLAHNSNATVKAARELYQCVPQPNLMVEIPATSQGISALRRLVSEGHSVNVTLIVSLARYGQVIDAYLAGLESLGGNLSRCHCVASFCLSRLDTEVDRRLEAIGTAAALSLRSKTAVAHAKVAYRMFEERFFGTRWQALVTRGAKIQRPLWSWTTVENPAYPDLWYVENLVGPNTVTALSETTIAALEDHGTVARTIDQGLDEAEATLAGLDQVGIDLEDVGRAVEHEVVSAWSISYDRLLSARAGEFPRRQPDAY